MDRPDLVKAMECLLADMTEYSSEGRIIKAAIEHLRERTPLEQVAEHATACRAAVESMPVWQRHILADVCMGVSDSTEPVGASRRRRHGTGRPR